MLVLANPTHCPCLGGAANTPSLIPGSLYAPILTKKCHCHTATTILMACFYALLTFAAHLHVCRPTHTGAVPCCHPAPAQRALGITPEPQHHALGTPPSRQQQQQQHRKCLKESAQGGQQEGRSEYSSKRARDTYVGSSS